ncbi:phage baseplate assembly protein V [Vibrio sp. Sgm 5]|uniref:phage baseplate assembly protein V n=1 Tax=Vibrio sp. Sgm 5 TaxID=2994387 RepID=UPI0022494406|nr:phage baseplate assembly protein V [Vibrio sp. Sgm 5]MCX2788354.1 phage baseplate assembly protein V [Vibrio sp. Sgm 5]
MQWVAEIRKRIDRLYERLTRIISVGEVIDVDAHSHRVKVSLKGLDGVPTVWLPVLVSRAKGASVVHNLDVGEQVVCLFPPIGDMAKGYVMGSSYNQEDRPFVTDAKVLGIRLSDGTTMTYDENKKTLLIEIAEGGPVMTMTKDGTKLKSKLDIEGAVSISETLTVKKDISTDANIKAKKEVMDKVGSMTQIRTIYNGHNHVAPKGPTTTPNQPMG